MHQTFFKADMRPAALEREDRRKVREAQDEKESAKVRSRSGGRCEVFEMNRLGGWLGPVGATNRCPRRGNQTHHMIGGWGKRARGISLKAQHKQYVCQQCHDDIGGHILRRIGGTPPLWTDCYERVR